MASNLKIAVALRNVMGDALIAALGASPLIDIYDGVQPANPGVAVTTQVKLGTLTCAATPAPATALGVVTFNAVTQDSAADAAGTAAWYRLKTAAGVPVIDGSVGVVGADLNLNTTTVLLGGPIGVSGFTYTMPGG